MIPRDYRDEFAAIAPEGAVYSFEIDAEGGWWLTEAGRRGHQTKPWRPAEDCDVLAAVTLLYMLNQLGPVPITGEYARAAAKLRISDQDLRVALMQRAYGMYLRHLRR
ncbi:hypothetical protein ACFYUV_20370 [Nonomuraea sp. NPDC003560]|uniref:hypothetical protein n=1 Tax=Nonomuraea sp. NPDC003560 TaxID=3364341 RepID=UPI003677A299